MPLINPYQKAVRLFTCLSSSKSYDFINIYHFHARLHSGHIYDKIIGIKCSKGHSRMKYDFGVDSGNLGFMSLGKTHS